MGGNNKEGTMQKMELATGNREKLQALANRAAELLETRGRYYTDGAKLAIKEMLQAAQRALDGKDGLPFKRNREFYTPREEEAIRFATRRYTMAPPFKEGSVFAEYGLEPALEWFEQQDMLAGGKEALLRKSELVIDMAKELLAEATFGATVGSFCESAGRRLREALRTLETEQDQYSAGGYQEPLALAVVNGFNRLRELRHSRVLRTDADPSASLYLDQAGLERVKAVIASDTLVGRQYEEIIRISEHYSSDYIEKAAAMIMDGNADYQELNRHFYLWSSTDKIINFRTPKEAVQATISFVLPSEENEEGGLGHVWIDNVDIQSASGGSLSIRNGGFDEGEEMPDCWIPEIRSGNPIMNWEQKYPFCGGGDRSRLEPANPSSQTMPQVAEGVQPRSLYICNPTREDEGAWRYGETFEVDGEAGYTLTFEAKMDGKLKKGLKAVLTFLDQAGRQVGVFEQRFNRKSSIPGGRFQLAMQCDAIRYAMTGEAAYARKVKNQMLYMFHDFCQGAEHWLTTNLRPEGSDSYGAVQGGRLLSSAAVSYSLIRQADVFSGRDKDRLYELIAYLLHYMLDLRDRTEWTPCEAQRGCSNWQTDMCAGTGLMMMTLPDFPNRHAWLYNANAILKAQLELNVNPDSSWPESIRYHHAALERFAGYAKVLHHVMGENWFETTPLARMFGFSIEMQTPGYAYFSGHIGTPPFGDHALSGGEEFGSFAIYMADVAKLDIELADRMHQTWTAAGKPFKKLWGEGIVLENLLSCGDVLLPAKPLRLGSTDRFPDAGIYIFRKQLERRMQSYFAIMSSPKPVGHGHLDQGSFILYKNSVPLVMDSGIEGYFDSSTSWHISSYSHACLQFATMLTEIPKKGSGAINLSAGTYSLERGWADGPRTSRVLNVTLGQSIDSITIEIANPEGKGRHIRHVSCLKQPELYVIRDLVEDFDGQVLFTLPVAAAHTTLEGKRLYSQCAYNVDLETAFLGPVHSIRLEKGRSTRFFDSGDAGFSMMDYIRAVADAKDGFLTILHPKERGQPKLEFAAQTDGTTLVKADNEWIKLSVADHSYGVGLLRTERGGDR